MSGGWDIAGQKGSSVRLFTEQCEIVSYMPTVE